MILILFILALIFTLLTIVGLSLVVKGQSIGTVIVFGTILFGWIGVLGFVPCYDFDVKLKKSEYFILKYPDKVSFIYKNNIKVNYTTDEYLIVKNAESVKLYMTYTYNIYHIQLRENFKVK